MSGFNLSDASSAPAPQRPDAAAPLASTSEAAQKTRRARWKLLLLLLVCVSPVVASYFTYYVVRPEGRRNFGTLVQPQRPMPDLATTTLGGQSGSLRTLRDQWLLVSVAPGHCDERCRYESRVHEEPSSASSVTDT